MTPRSLPGEAWADIEGWPAYQVSNRSRVRSLPRTVQQTGGRANAAYRVSGCILKPVPNSRGGMMVTLYRSGARRSYLVSTLVRRMFGGNDG